MQTDYLVVGAGIIGLTVARNLNKKYPNKSILIIDKENDIAKHASGRNSGVLHAGLYYAADSLKAKFCVAGNQKIREYSQEKNILLNACGKVIVAMNDAELQQLKDLYQTAKNNGVEVHLVDSKQLDDIEPNAKTHELAIYSPNTASFNSLGICSNLQRDLIQANVKFQFNTQFTAKLSDNSIQTNQGVIHYNTLVNCAGVYADKIAQQYDLIQNYTLIPFKGIFLYTENLSKNYTKHIYPLPDQKLKLPGVHFSPEYNGNIKLGPTAVPCLSRENYSWMSNLKFNEMKEIIFNELRLFVTNELNFRDLAMTEMKRQTKSGLIKFGTNLVKDINQFKFTNWGTPGIQPRLYDMHTHEILDDFLVVSGVNSVHVVNSVSPAFTASFAFSEFVVEQYL